MFYNQRYHYINTNQPRHGVPQPFSITVKGEGRINMTPDRAKINLGVVTENASVQEAQQENATISNQVIQALKQTGIDESAIRTTIYTVYPRYDYIDGKSILRGYGVEHQFEVTINDLTSVGMIYDLAIKNGVNRSGEIQFFVANPDIHYREALRKALHDANEKAKEIATTIGVHLSVNPYKIKEIFQQQEIRPRPLYESQVAGVSTQNVPPIQSGEYQIKAEVEVVYVYSG